MKESETEMAMKYETPVMNVIHLASADVVRTSGDPADNTIDYGTMGKQFTRLITTKFSSNSLHGGITFREHF